MTKHQPTPAASEPAAAAPRALDAIPRDRCINQHDGYVTAVIDANPLIRRGDGSPSEEGDVLSVQPDGTLQARESGACGAYELALPSGNWLVYRPVITGNCFLVSFAPEWPSV